MIQPKVGDRVHYCFVPAGSEGCAKGEHKPPISRPMIVTAVLDDEGTISTRHPETENEVWPSICYAAVPKPGCWSWEEVG